MPSLVDEQKGLTNLLDPNDECGGNMETYTWGQNDWEIVIRIPLPERVTAKHVDINIGVNLIRIGFKGDAPILSGTLYKPIKDSESLWTIEDKVLTVNLQKTNLKHEEWWPHVVKDSPQIDMRKFKPPSKHIRDLDDGAQAAIHKMMFDQQQKHKGLPTSDELQIQNMMK